MSRLTEVVKHLLIINVLIYFGATMLMPQMNLSEIDHRVLYLFYPGTEYFQPFQLITHMFMHGSTSHILFNMMSLFFLGPMVEQSLGSKKFLMFYLLCGFGAMLLHLGIDSFSAVHVPVVGASGAIMGIFTAFAVLFPDTKLMLLFPPIPIKAKFLMIGLIAFDLFSGVSGISTGIAHFAHLGGVLAGFILMLSWGYVKRP